jgi:predicted RNA-binding Zn-ribbon protein involved in translation (DUF1610 family)
MAEAMRKAGVEHWSGGLQNWITKKVKGYGIDTTHFLGMGRNRGSDHKGGPKKLHWTEVLVLKPSNKNKTCTSRLRRAMIEAGIDHQCLECGQLPSWNNKLLVLQIDHRNGNPHDHRIENVRFLCPNCHTQTENFSFRGARIKGQVVQR